MFTVAAVPTVGAPELIIILVIFVVLFGAKKLPELGSSVGKSIRNFKKGLDEGRAQDEAAEASNEADDTAEVTRDSE